MGNDWCYLWLVRIRRFASCAFTTYESSQFGLWSCGFASATRRVRWPHRSAPSPFFHRLAAAAHYATGESGRRRPRPTFDRRSFPDTADTIRRPPDEVNMTIVRQSYHPVISETPPACHFADISPSLSLVSAFCFHVLWCLPRTGQTDGVYSSTTFRCKKRFNVMYLSRFNSFYFSPFLFKQEAQLLQRNWSTPCVGWNLVLWCTTVKNHIWKGLQ